MTKTPRTSPAKVVLKPVSRATIKRSFKTKWFAKEAGKFGIPDIALCDAIKEVMAGQAEDLGGGVWKKRLNKNMDRSIIVAKGGRYWIYVYLFAKSSTANINQDELKGFKSLATAYGKAGQDKINELVKSKELTEICNDCDH